MTVWAIVVAAGRGERFGGSKQLADLGDGRRPIDLAVAAARGVAGPHVVLVLPPGSAPDRLPAPATVVAGGDTRSDSVRAGLAAIGADAPDDTVVVVHDGARPWATPALFAAVVDAVRGGADGAVPGVSVTDTVKQVDGDRVAATLDRATLVAVQTPQAFRLDVLRRAHAGGADATDDAALVEALGATVVVVPGEPANRKITTPADLVAAAASTMRVGSGFDSHAFSDDADRPLLLGGVRFEGPGLAGHSDGDALAHAVTDALLGAAGLGDIGTLHPDTDERWAGADSLELLRGTVERVREAGFVVANVDCVVVAERPRLAPARGAVESALSAAVGAPVSVKGKRPEGLGAASQGVVQCWATVLLARTELP